MGEKKKIIIATVKSWNIANAEQFKEKYEKSYEVILLRTKDEFTVERVKGIHPDFIFFPHWNWIIPKEIHQNYRCILFHMTDLPFGRGGSPLQNLIQNKVFETKISAIEVAERLDAGRVFLKERFYIGLGDAEEIFQKVSEVVFHKMIPKMIENNLIPHEQEGEITMFRRRSPEESDLMRGNILNLEDLYNFIRMLDAEDYPRAFLKMGRLKMMFSEVHKRQGRVVGRFEVIDEEK